MMKNIPKKYFKESNLTEALLNIRRCLGSGLTIEQMAKEITENYTCAKLSQKETLGLLLTSVYDFSETDRDTVDKCAEMFKTLIPEDRNPDRSLSFEIYKYYCADQETGFPWLTQYTDKVFHWEGIEQYYKNPDLWMIIHDHKRDWIFTLCKDADLYCYVDEKLTVNLFCLACIDEDVFITEEPHDDKKPPYYWTENYYMVSPVYMVRVAKKILEYCLQRIGYPMVNIILKVFFTSLTTKITNKDDYMENGPYTDKWKGVDVYEYKDFSGYAFPYRDYSLFQLFEDFIDEEMITMLSSSLSATAMMFSELYEHDDLVDHSPSQLRNLAKRLEIFVK